MADGAVEGTAASGRQVLSADSCGNPITISDVITKLNATIRANVDVAASIVDQSIGSTQFMKGFELHTRLPDGSARPANTKEIATADFQTKLQHAMATLQSLPDESSRLKWAENQRTKVGNIYYEKQEYESAIDVYLVCLTVATPSHSSDPESKYTIEHLILYMKLMNNLALCTLQLCWYRKTITFCSIAIDQIILTLPKSDQPQDENDDITVTIIEQRIKLHYKRAKAYRLRGEYVMAQRDIGHVRNEMSPYSLDKARGPKSIQMMHIAIFKEEHLLQRAIHEGNKNSKQHQKAMKQLLKPNDDSRSTETAHIKAEQSHVNSRSEILQSLYYDHHNVGAKIQRKNFSSLRARKYDKNGCLSQMKRSTSATEDDPNLKFQSCMVTIRRTTLNFIVWVCHLLYFILSLCFRSRKEKM